MTPQQETAIRLSCFGAVLLAMSLWELAAPRRRLTVRKAPRWFSNLALVAINSIVARLVAGLSAVAMAALAAERGWGLLNSLDWPSALEIALGVVALDLVIYLQHVMFHAVPVLWRLHQVHHADLDFDVTTGLRFHTIEIVLSMGLKVAAVAALGPAVWSVLLFEVLLNATSMFNHGNVRLPARLDRVLRWLIVTPEMHRVHHSVVVREANSNFGFNLPWWDYLCGTYRDQPAAGHESMTIGVSHLRDERQVDRLHRMLLLPFVGSVGEYPVNRRSGGVNPMDRLADEYDRWFDSAEGRPLFDIELACLRDVLGDHAGRWLEVGVGTGRFAAALGIREGIDPSEPALTIARGRGIDARRGSAEQLPCSDSSFDGVLLVVTICFLHDVSMAMREFQRVLKPGGRLVIGMIPRDSPWGRSYADKGRQGHPFYSTARFYSPHDVISLAADAGFAFDRACNCLFSPAEVAPSPERRAGIAKAAGFVCLAFSRRR